MAQPGWQARAIPRILTPMPNRKSSEAVGTRLDRLAWKPIHTWITLALGIGWLLDAFEVNVVGNVLGVLRDLWHLSDAQASAIVSVWLVGLMIGALFFGYLADRFGRRKLFLITLLLYSCATVISALSPGYWFFLCFRFLTAIGVGAEYSAINAAIGELIPARYRGRANATVMNFWPLGTILAAAITLYFINLFPPSVGWRFAFALGAIIALFTLWVRRVLPESPRWLFAKGRESEARAILDGIEGGAARFSAGGAASGHDGAQNSMPGFWSQLRRLLSEHPGRLALGCALDFTEAAGYYGIFAFLPLVVLPHVGIGQRQVPMFFLIGNVGAIVGGILAAAFLDKAGRKATVTSFYVLAALSMLGMGAATMGGNARGVLWAFIVVNFCATGSWISAYPTFSEIFPTSLRSTGIGASVAFGRIGAALAPPLLVFLSHEATPMIAFAVLAGFYGLGAATMVPWWIWGPEGRGCPLEILAGEKSP
jgi:MFS family permease